MKTRPTLIKEKGKKQNNKCYWCEEPLNDKLLTLDHIVPRSWGGLMIEDNVVLTCRECNQKKLDRMWIKRKRGFADVHYLKDTKTSTIIDEDKKRIIIKTTIRYE